jgi:acetyltransferase-like isoleucine patch superfamily enzyme
VINGGCIVGEGVFFGSTAMAREYIEIGTRCVVEAGSKVMKDIADDKTHKCKM